jgi:hypothetical protein
VAAAAAERLLHASYATSVYEALSYSSSSVYEASSCCSKAAFTCLVHASYTPLSLSLSLSLSLCGVAGSDCCCCKAAYTSSSRPLTLVA